MELKIPKVREGSYFPSLLESRRRSEKALLAVVQQAYVEGVSTRRVEIWSSPWAAMASPRARSHASAGTWIKWWRTSWDDLLTAVPQPSGEAEQGDPSQNRRGGHLPQPGRHQAFGGSGAGRAARRMGRRPPLPHVHRRPRRRDPTSQQHPVGRCLNNINKDDANHTT